MQIQASAPAHLLSTADEIRDLASALRGQEAIAFDTEFIRETTFFPIVEIIQIATREQSWLVDAHAFKKGYRPGPQSGFDPGLRPLLDVLEDPRILKIVHAAQGDEECLYTSFGIVASPILDTATAASLCGYGEAIGLGRLLKLVLDIAINKGHARTNWSVRPLPEQLAEYAHADVKYLVQLGQELMRRLDEMGRRPWALELSSKWEDRKLYEADVDGIAQKLSKSGRLDKREYATLIELVRWREDRVRQLNLPRRWVADDTVLLDLAHARPKDLAHLGTFRGLNKGELKNSGEAILSAIRRGQEQSGQVQPPRSGKPDLPTPEEGQVLELLRCYVSILADRHRIAAKHLLTSAQFMSLLRNTLGQPEDLVKLGILNDEAARLIGGDLIAFVEGRKALSVRAGQVVIQDMERPGPVQ